MDIPFDLDMQSGSFRVLLIAALSVGVVIVLMRIALRLVRRYVTDPTRLYVVTKRVRRIGITAIFVVLAIELAPDSGSLLTVLTVIGAGLAIATREVLLSALGWLHITFGQPFGRGDRIEVNGLRGDVVDVRVLRTTLMECGGWVDADQSTGRLVHMPNSWALLHSVYNYTHGFHYIWNELPFTFTFESDHEAARALLLDLAEVSSKVLEHDVTRELRQMSSQYLVHYSILTPFVYTSVVDNGVRLTLRYLCAARKRRGTAHALTQSLIAAVSQRVDLHFAVPTLRLVQPSPPAAKHSAEPPPQGEDSARAPRDADG